MKWLVTALVLCFSCVSANAGVIYVDAGASGAANGSSWTDAYPSIAAAIDKATANDQVWVAEGTYGPISLKSGVKLYGGFSGVETAASQSDPNAHKTIISGGGTQQAIQSVNNSSATVLRGFVVQDGVTLDWSHAGGAVSLVSSSAVFAFCEFKNNTAAFAGGAIGIRQGGSPKFLNCTFRGNGAITGKPTPVGGGAVFIQSGSPTFANCLFHNNKAGDGGAIVNLHGSPQIVNCTFSGNEATKRQGGAIFDNAGQAVVRNCILWQNTTAITGSAEIYNSATLARTTDVQNSDVKGGWTGQGNIDSSPLFLSTGSAGFELTSSSPCKGKGLRAALPTDLADLDWDQDLSERVPVDLAGNLLGSGTYVDMGAFRYTAP